MLVRYWSMEILGLVCESRVAVIFIYVNKS